MFRFTIRDVLWLTMVVGLACGWGMSHMVVMARWEAAMYECQLEQQEFLHQSRRRKAQHLAPGFLNGLQGAM